MPSGDYSGSSSHRREWPGLKCVKIRRADFTRVPIEMSRKLHIGGQVKAAASHVVEHFDYNGELVATLTEWHRVPRKLVDRMRL
jgi:hypothetical protein